MVQRARCIIFPSLLGADDGFVEDIQERILELMQPSTTHSNLTSPSSSMGVLPSTIPSPDSTTRHPMQALFNAAPNHTPSPKPSQPAPSSMVAPAPPLQTLTSALADDIEILDDNLHSLTYQLGLGDGDLAKLDTMDVDKFLEEYLNSSQNPNPEQALNVGTLSSG
jgi:hypothetical protein